MPGLQVRVMPQGARHRETVQAGQHDVQQDQVGAVLAQLVERLWPALGLQHAEAVQFQVAANDIAQGGFIINDQDGLCSCHPLIVRDLDYSRITIHPEKP